MRRAFSILGLRPMAFVYAFGVLLGMISLCCGFGLFLSFDQLARLLRAVLDGAEEKHGLPEGEEKPRFDFRAFFFFVLFLGPCLGPALGGAVLAGELNPLEGSPLLLVAIAFVAPSLLLILAAPLLFVPLAIADGEEGAIGPFLRSVERAGALGARRMIGHALEVGLLLGTPLWLTLGTWVSEDLRSYGVVALSVAAWLVTLPYCAAHLADSYIEAREKVGTEAAPAEVVAGMGRFAWLLGPVLVALAAVHVVALATPTPMRVTEARPASAQQIEWLDGGSVLRIPDTAINLEREGRVLTVTMADGGGAGRVRAPESTGFGDPSVSYRSRRRGPDPHGQRIDIYYRLSPPREGEPQRYATFTIDELGVRLDDDLSRRLASRIGWEGSVLLFLALAFGLLLVHRQGRELALARLLASPRLDAPEAKEGEGAPAEGSRSALGGHLRLTEGANAAVEGGRLRVNGEGFIEALGGSLRLRVPEAGLELVGEVNEPADGARVTVMARFGRLSPMGLRDAGGRLPEDAILVLGSPEQAAQRLSKAALRRLTLFLSPLLALVLVVVGIVLVRL